MPTVRLDIQYDGTDFHGFQKQPAQRTVAGELEKCCAILCNEPVRIIGAGRTDAGVHAVRQVVSFTTSAQRGTDALVRGLNSLLSPDISVLSSAIVPDCFHARFSAKARSYKYFLMDHNVNLALLRRYAYVFPHPLDADLMREAARFLVGTRNFRSFAAGPQSVPCQRTLFSLEIEHVSSWVHPWLAGPTRALSITLEADSFLYQMARIIVGTLLDVGAKRREPEDLARILEAQDRRRAGKTAPPQGLYLWDVKY